MLNKNTDIIRDGDKDYVNVNSNNRLIAQLVSTSAETVYGFNIPFGSKVDTETKKEMNGTYWLRAPKSDNIEYDEEDVQIVTL